MNPVDRPRRLSPPGPHRLNVALDRTESFPAAWSLVSAAQGPEVGGNIDLRVDVGAPTVAGALSTGCQMGPGAVDPLWESAPVVD